MLDHLEPGGKCPPACRLLRLAYFAGPDSGSCDSPTFFGRFGSGDRVSGEGGICETLGEVR
jgi:hypothetical protein